MENVLFLEDIEDTKLRSGILSVLGKYIKIWDGHLGDSNETEN